MVAASKGKLTAADRRKLVSLVAGKVVQMMQGKIGYDANGGGVHFLNGYFMSPLNGACSTFVGIIAYITGNTKPGGENSWYPPTGVYRFVEGYSSTFYKKLNAFYAAQRRRGYSPYGDRFWGVSSIAYNRDILSQPKYDLASVKSLFNNPAANANELKSLEGRVIMWKPTRFDSIKYRGTNIRQYQETDGKIFYTHTLIIGPVDVQKGTITIYESNYPDGIRAQTISFAKFKAGMLNTMKYFDVFDFNN